MKFSTKEDIEAPSAVVFAGLTDFPAFERAALRRGAEFMRMDTLDSPGVGMGWNVRFPLRGKWRRVICELREYDTPNRIAYFAESTGFDMVLELDLVALSRSRTRLGVQFDIRPRTLPARVKLQSAKLIKSNLARRFATKVQKFAADLELRHLKLKMP
ncbi:MAG: SRPBCC family protein [Rhodobacteraceae bacterium]|nr:SRPBCC family protein [Paracoccaceae bacterium]